MNKNVINYVIGKTFLDEVYIVNQEEPIAISSYYVVKDEINEDLIGEVIDTTSIPCLTEKYLNEIYSDIDCLQLTNLDKNKTTYIGKLKILRNLVYPITPLSQVKKANFEEIKPYVYKTDVNEGFNIGVIKGTEIMQNELPQYLQNVSPLWENKMAVQQQGIPFVLNADAQREYPHIFISGGSGSGKSFAYRVMLEELMKFRYPGIVVDLHNEMVFDTPMPGLTFNPQFKGCYDIFVVGKDIGIDFKDLTITELVTLISHKEPLSDAQRRILERIYIQGMDINDFKHQLEILASAFGKMDSIKAKESDLIPEEKRAYDIYKNYVTSSDTIRSILSKFLVIESSGIFYGNISKVKMCLKQSKLAVIRGNVTITKMLLSYMINRFYSERRYYIDNNIHNPNDPKFFPPFFLFLDEAHNFAPKEGNNLPLRDLLRKLGQESRKYGVYLVLCTQGPGLLDKTLLDQMNTKIFLRTTDIVNKDIAKNEINLTDTQYKLLPNLPSGNGFIASPILSKTFHIQFRTSFTMQPKTEGIFDELKQLQIGQNSSNEIQDLICNWIANTPNPTSRGKALLLVEINKQGHSLDINNLTNIINDMEQKQIIIIERNSLGEKYRLP